MLKSWRAVIALVALYAPAGFAGSCFIDFYDQTYTTNHCYSPVTEYICENAGNADGEYIDGDCPSDNRIGYCVWDYNGDDNVDYEYHYYEGDTNGRDEAWLKESCERTFTEWFSDCPDCGGGEPDDGWPAAFTPLDAEGMVDIWGEGTADIAILNGFHSQSEGPVVGVMPTPLSENLYYIEFFNQNYRPLRMDVGADANQDGGINDPFIAVLAKNRKTKETWVQVKDATYGTKLQSNLRFFSENYDAIDVAVLDDTNGDGVPDDPSVAVLAQKKTSGRQAVMLRSLVTGKKLGNWTITQANSDVLAIVGETVQGTAPNNARLAVLAVKNSGSNEGNSSVLQIRVADGTILSKKAVSSSSLRIVDMAAREGGSGYIMTSEPALVLLGEKSSGASKVIVRDLKRNTKLAEFSMLSDPWESRIVGVAPDFFHTDEDAFVIAVKPSNDHLRVKGRDAQSGDAEFTLDIDDE